MSKRVLIVMLFIAFDVLVFLFVFDRIMDSTTSSNPGAQHSAESDGWMQPSESSSAAERARRSVVSGTRAPVSTEIEAAGLADSTVALDATLVVRVVAGSSRHPLDAVRVVLESRDLALARTPVPVEASTGVLGDSPVTDANGEVRIGVPSGVELDLEATSARDEAGSIALVVPALEKGERRELVVELPSGDDLRVCGLVLDADDKRPIAGASVSALTIAGGAAPNVGTDAASAPRADVAALKEHPIAACVSDVEGRFIFSLASWRDPYMRVSAPGFGPALADLGAGHETADHPLVVLLRRSATIEARIVDEVGQAIPDVTVSVYVEAYRLQLEPVAAGSALASAPDVEWKTTTAADGSCVLQGLESGMPLRVHFARKSAPLRDHVELAALVPGEKRSVDWMLNLGCTLAGALVDEKGTPVARCDVWVFRADEGREGYSRDQLAESKTTDDAGRFVLRDVPAGSLYVGPAPVRRADEPPGNGDLVAQGELVTVGLGVRTQEVVVHARQGTHIRGRVVDASGAPPTRFMVTLRPMNSTQRYFYRNQEELSRGLSAHPGPNGTFVSAPLSPGEFELTATAYEPRKDSMPATVTARGGDENVIIELKRIGLVTGRVTDARTGEPVFAQVRASPLVNRETSNPRKGEYTIAGLSSGTYCLIARTADGRIGVLRDVAVTAGVDMPGLDIAVERGSMLRLHYKGSRTTCPFRVQAGELLIAASGLRPMEMSMEVVPAGKVLIYWQAKEDGEFTARELEVAAGEEKYFAITDDG